jgi:dimeric dUTPase (all-alpha-NTP-PPase superfamily)
MRQQFITMLEMQERMNRKVHPDWIKQNFAWHRALWIECGELIEHHGYKWWKKQEPAWAHVRLELVDIWHFGMSMCFDGSNTPGQIADQMLDQLALERPAAVPLLEAVEALATDVLVRRCFSVVRFWTAMEAAGLDSDSLFTAYVGKNVLNFFRQDHGYKDGSYHKKWDGREDNEHLSELLECLDRHDSAFPERLYAALEERYRQAAFT